MPIPLLKRTCVLIFHMWPVMEKLFSIEVTLFYSYSVICTREAHLISSES